MTTYQPPASLKPGDTVRVVGHGSHTLHTVKTVGRKWLTVEDSRARIDMEAGEYEKNYLGDRGEARVYRPEDPAGWADVHRIKVASLLSAARSIVRQYDGIGARAAVPPEDEAIAVIDAYTRLLDTIRTGPTNPELTPRPRAPHDHEEWMIRTAPDGHRYCAACGDTIPDAAATKENR